MNVGLFAPLANPFATPEMMHVLGEGAEERGFHSLWAGEHVVLFDEYRSRYPYSPDGKIPAPPGVGMLEPFDALAFLAADTKRIRLGTGVCLVPQRSPVYTAKQVATLDWLASGRFDFGVGIGWLEEEFRALNVPFARRNARCREYLQVMRTLWCDDVSEFHGEFWDLPPCRQFPKPIQQPHPPIHFGGETDAALRRVADLGQGWHGFNHDPASAADRIAWLRRLLADRGRSPDEVEISICPYFRPVDLDMVKRFRDVGVDQVVLVLMPAGPDEVRRTLDELANVIVERARAL
jgi:probable F420-dependent oxidoreductase